MYERSQSGVVACARIAELADRIGGLTGNGPRLNWRRVFTASFAVFGVVVSSSFAYGVYLLAQVPRTPPRAPRAEPQPADVAALLGRGKAHLEKKEVEQALVAFRRVLFARPSLEAQLGLAEGERMAGREELAAAEYDRVLRLEAREPTALRELARIRSGRRETWPQAEAHYRLYLAIRPDDARAQLGLARLLAWQERPGEAIEIYPRPAVEPLLTPGDRRDFALALVTAGRHEEAEGRLETLLAATPGDHDVALALAGLRASRGDWETALPLYRAVLDSRPDDPAVNRAYGLGLLARREYAAALGPLGRAVRSRPEDAPATLAYARAARAARRSDLADAQFDRAVALDPDNAPAAREYADLLAERRNYRKAEGLYRRAHAAGVRDDGLLLGFAGVLTANEKPGEAVPLLEQVYARRPTDRLAFDLARLHRKLGNHARALELLADIER